MKIDLSFLLVMGSLLTGGIWLGYRLLVTPAQPDSVLVSGRREPRLVEYSRVLFPVTVIVLIIRSFVFEPYKIPTPSMVPTLLIGDFIFVSKFAYGLRLPITNARILSTGRPQRGDVAVFRLPSDPTVNYIKRVVGLPNDRIKYHDHELFVNDERVEVRFWDERFDVEGAPDARLGEEVLDGNGHAILHLDAKHDLTVQDFQQTVPEGHYFMMGDNRDNSQDSRSSLVGFVPESNLVGKAVIVWLNVNDWQRVGDSIR